MATKMACSMPSCPETMTTQKHLLRPICETHWQMLPPELQKAILAARHHGPRKQAEEMIRARQWLALQ